MRRQDQQVSTSYQSDPTDPLTFVFITANAAKGENYGVESQWAWQPLRAWRFGANLGLLRARYIDYARSDMNLSGRDQPHAPRWQFSVSADWQGSAGLYAHADVNGKDAFYFSGSDDQRTDAYALVNLRAGWRSERWSVNAWVRNVFDQRYITRGFYFGNEPPDYAPKRYVDNGDPRQAGVSASFVLY
jgi:outer membrane receptor protein involved in Fe transport